MKKKSVFLIAAAIVLAFALINAEIFILLTRRTGNNFGDAASLKSIEISDYIPFTDGADTVVLSSSSLKLTDSLPVLDGAAALVPIYASVIENVYPENSVSFDGESFAAGSAMQYGNTKGSYKAVVDGTSDIIFCAGPSESQKQYASDAGVELVYVPIGLEAFVFFVNSRNPVDSLSSEQIRGIYAGTYRNWADVGGANRAINPVTRPDGSGSQTAMLKFMGDTGIGDKSILAATGGSIGYSFRYYLSGMVDNSSVKMISLDGVYPSAENIRNGTYPVITKFYAIYRKDNSNPNIQPLIDWILSEEGQSIVEQAGYVGIN